MHAFVRAWGLFGQWCKGHDYSHYQENGQTRCLPSHAKTGSRNDIMGYTHWLRMMAEPVCPSCSYEDEEELPREDRSNMSARRTAATPTNTYSIINTLKFCIQQEHHSIVDSILKTSRFCMEYNHYIFVFSSIDNYKFCKHNKMVYIYAYIRFKSAININAK